MSKCVRIVIPGQPVPKERPRATRRGHIYTPKKTKDYEELVKQIYKAKYRNAIFEKNVPLSMDIIAYFGIPKSDSKAKKKKKSNGEILPTIKADADNICKIIMDALNGVAYMDDKQITDIHVLKRYSDNTPRVDVMISEVNGNVES